jgi:hypothetical protein
MSNQPLTPDQLAIITAYQALSQALAGPTPTGTTFRPIPTRAQPTITGVKPLQVKVGTTTQVTITGTDLDTTSSVHLGAQAAQNVKATPTQVTFDATGLQKATAKILVMTNLGGILSPTDFTVS